MKKIFCLISIAASCLLSAAPWQQENPEVYWDIDLLKIKPDYRQAPWPDSQYKGLQAIMINGFGRVPGDRTILSSKPNPLSAKKRAEFFAYMGFPDTPVPEGGFPGVVLIHGGGGTAFPQYAKRWMAKGYAVIILDWYNCRPIPPEVCTEVNVKHTSLAGGRRQDNVSSVANIILAHTVLRSQKNVNPEKTAFVGLSWGSRFGVMVAAIDNRFKGGVEIYCGDVTDNDEFINGRFHHAAKVPLYWIVGTDDRHITLKGINKAFKYCPTTYNRSIVDYLPHSHMGFDFECVSRMVSHFLKGTPNLPKLSDIKVSDGVASAQILDHGKGITHAYLCYTESTDPVQYKRPWKKRKATVKGNTVSAEVPPKANSYFLTVYDGKSRHRTLCGSTDVMILDIKK